MKKTIQFLILSISFLILHCLLALSGIEGFIKKVNAQDDLVHRTFEDTRIVNGHSIETNKEGVMKFIISHRFGKMSDGAYELFGLDQASMRIGFDYGITNWLTIGVGRSTFEKTGDGFIKAKLLKQSSKMPFSMAYLGAIAVYGLKWEDETRENLFSSRLFYTHQLLLARKFSDGFSLQIMPTLVHRNLVETAEDKNDILSIGIAPRIQITKTFVINAEYYYVLPNQLPDGLHNALALGFQFETKGHVFQLQFGNSRGMTEKFFVTQTTGNWLDGDIHFGFNITRDFTLKGRKR